VAGEAAAGAVTEAGVAAGAVAADRAGGVSSAEHTPTAKRQIPTASQRI
jgi:hypothetical protein